MTTLDELKKVRALGGDTYSSAEVIGLVGRAADEIERLRAALEVCAADFTSTPGTVTSVSQEIAAEFQSRMQVAADALDVEQVGD